MHPAKTALLCLTISAVGSVSFAGNGNGHGNAKAQKNNPGL